MADRRFRGCNRRSWLGVSMWGTRWSKWTPGVSVRVRLCVSECACACVYVHACMLRWMPLLLLCVTCLYKFPSNYPCMHF